MPEYEKRTWVRERERDDPSDDEGYSTVRRYKVTPNKVERVERIEREQRYDYDEDDTRSRYSTRGGGDPRRSQGDLLQVDRQVERVYLPERPRSAFDPAPRNTTTVTKREVIESDRGRERDYYYEDRDRDRDRRGDVRLEREVIKRDSSDPYDGDRTRTVVQREVIERDRDDDRYRDRDRAWEREDRDRSRTVLYERTKEVEHDRDRDREPMSARDWDRRSHAPWDHDDEVRYEKDVRIERRVDDRRDEPRGEVERYRKETEYYEPAPQPAPIVIRQRAPEQRIILQEAPAPPPIVVREENREVVRREPQPREDEYYYRRREVGPYRGEREEEEYAVERYDRRDRRRDRRYSDGEVSDDDYYIKRTVIRKERSRSPDEHRKLHLAEGALAGAGIAALAASRRNGEGDFQEHRGRKVLAGAALGALGTEVVKRARSAYQDRFGEDEDHVSPERHSKLKTGLGIAAAALAVAGAAKYYQSSKVEKEEMHRGRSRHRGGYSSDEYSVSRSVSRKRSRSRAGSIAKAGAATAAVAGLVQHFRSKSRGGSKSRSRSRLRTGAEIVAAGLAGAAGKKLYDRHKDKKEDRERELDEEEEWDRERRRSSRSRSRSVARAPYPDPGTADPELGMVEYGAHPLYSEPPYPEYGHGPAGARDRDRDRDGYDSAAEEGRRHRRHRHHGSRSRDDDYSASSEDDRNEAKKKRSRSRLRDLATGAAAAGAAAIGLKKYGESKEKKGRERESRERDDRDHERERERERQRDRDRDRRSRDRERRRYEEETAADYDDVYDPQRPPSPPHASGGAYYPPPPAAPTAPPAAGAPYPGGGGFTQHPNVATTNLNDGYQAYHPADYSGYPPPPPGPLPNTTQTPTGFPPPPTGGHAAGDHVSEAPPTATTRNFNGRSDRRDEDGVIASSSRSAPPPRPPSPSDSETVIEKPTDSHVKFIPLSPQSSRTLRKLHREQRAEDDDEAPSEDDDRQVVSTRSRRRRNSDPSSDRPLASRRRRTAVSDDEDEEEVIEVLPDRFDSEGKPLDARGNRIPRWTSRRGDFEYRTPRGQQGWNARGQWAVAGTDGEAVEKIVQDLQGVLEGRRSSWLGLARDLLGGGLLQGGAASERISDGGEKRRIDRDAYGDGEDDYDDGQRRRRRRRRDTYPD